MSDEIDNPYASPLGASEEENTHKLKTKGMVRVIFVGLFSGALMFAFAMSLTATFLFFSLILLGGFDGLDGSLFIVLIMYVIYGVIIGIVTGGLSGVNWHVARDQSDQFINTVLSGTAFSIVLIVGPQAYMFLHNYEFAILISLGVQCISIFIAVYLLNKILRNYAQS